MPSKVLSCPMCLVSCDKLTMFFPAVGHGVGQGLGRGKGQGEDNVEERV